MLSTLSDERRTLLAQLIRFVISGGTVTAVSVAVYTVIAVFLRWNPQLGNFIAYLVGVTMGYFLHSRWSFRDHGDERTHGTRLRFFAVSIVSYALNSLWVWLLVTHLHLGREMPVLPMLFVTPLVTFVLNRQWVFR